MTMPKKRIYTVTLLKPKFFKKKNKRKVKCLMCGLNYSIKDYQILFDAKKLMYFDVSGLNFWDPKEQSFLDNEFAVTCHGCLHKIAIKFAKNRNQKIIQMIIQDGEKKFTCNFYTDKDGGFLGGFS